MNLLTTKISFCAFVYLLYLGLFSVSNQTNVDEKTCITSSNSTDYPDDSSGDRGKPCVFPFKVRGKTYYSCTYDSAHRTNYRPWCSTRVDAKGFHLKESNNWGICSDRDICPIPPRRCGIPVSTKRASSNVQQNVDIEQQPWIVSLGEGSKKENETVWQHQCGGSLITDRHVLTAAHCFNAVLGNKRKMKKYRMLLGSSDLTSKSRYLNNPDYPGAFQMRKVVDIKVHPQYVQPKAYYDIGIAIADRNIEFNDYIRPVCLPFRPNEDPDELADKLVTLAGYGQYVDSKTGLIDIKPYLKLITLQVNSKYVCERLFNKENLRKQGIPLFKKKQQLPKGFRNEIICAGNDFDISQGSCEGDSGSPLVRRISDGARKEAYFEQAFIVSTGLSCKLKAQIFTRIADRANLRWIQDVTDTHPLLMVYGGYGKVDSSSQAQLLDNVELISTNKHFVCREHLRPIRFGDNTDVQEGIESDTQVVGGVGVFASDAAIICGGQNRKGYYKKCYEYDAAFNTWESVKDLPQERFLATAVRQEDGKMWVMGGIVDKDQRASTEEYTYRRSRRNRKRNLSRWKSGKPIPTDLRDSGIYGHCTVQINNTFVFIGGGYAEKYAIGDPSTERRTTPSPEVPNVSEGQGGASPRSIIDFLHAAGIYPNPQIGRDKRQSGFNTETLLEGGGHTLSRAWIYDGYYWREIPDMPSPRDRAACSLVEMDKGKRRILVAGGCEGSCKTNSATDKVLQYDIESNEWITTTSPLPEPVSNAKMEILEGLPTIIGGVNTDNRTQNDKLYQYYFATDEWKVHPRVKMEIGRSSPTVIEVPKELFGYCFANLESPIKEKDDYYTFDQANCLNDSDILKEVEEINIIEAGASPRIDSADYPYDYDDGSEPSQGGRGKRQANDNKICKCKKPEAETCTKICQHPKVVVPPTTSIQEEADLLDNAFVNLRSDSDVCYEGDPSCCKKICANPNNEGGLSEPNASDYSNDDEDNLKLIQLRTDSGLCFEGDESCCKIPCANPIGQSSIEETQETDLTDSDEENVNLIQLRQDSGTCFEGDASCCNAKLSTTDVQEDADLVDNVFVNLRSDVNEDYGCEVVGITNVASAGDLTDGIVDSINQDVNDEADATLIQLGVRTASKECTCYLPKKRCKKDPELGVRSDEQTQVPEKEVLENSFNEEYGVFPL